MQIELFYYTPYFNDYYFVYGSEKNSNGDIVINGPGYYFQNASDMIAKMDSMMASLAPEITNMHRRTQGNSFWICSGELNVGSSESPDYTQILTNINTNLTNISDKLKTSADNKTVSGCLERIFNCLNNGGITESPVNVRNNSYIRNSLFYNGNPQFSYGLVKILDNCLTSIYNMLRQSVSPNASITDVISALNATIDSKQDTTIVNNEVTPLAEINIDVPFEVKNLKKSDVENL